MKAREALKYRSVWLGAAMLMIALYHFLSMVFAHLGLRGPGFGYGGVDICIFASGLGCWFSLEKDGDIFAFYKRRFRRIAPTYLCAVVFWMLIEWLKTPLSFGEILGNLLGIQALTGMPRAFNWYISAIILFYILSPLLRELTLRLRGRVKQGLVVLLLVAISIPYFGMSELIVTMTRLPLFYLGMLCARWINEGGELKKSHFIWGAAAVLAGYGALHLIFRFAPALLWQKGLYWYTFILITPPLCLYISLAAAAFEKCRAGRLLLGWVKLLGENSFDFYMAHVTVFVGLLAAVSDFHILQDSFWIWAGMFPISLVCAWGLHCLVKGVTALVSRQAGR